MRRITALAVIGLLLLTGCSSAKYDESTGCYEDGSGCADGSDDWTTKEITLPSGRTAECIVFEFNGKASLSCFVVPEPTPFVTEESE